MFVVVVIAAGLTILANAPKKRSVFGYKDTPMLPGGEWHVHDGNRPQPRIVTPAAFSTQDEPGKPRSDAIVLFDGADLSKWSDRKGNPCGWTVGCTEAPLPS